MKTLYYLVIPLLVLTCGPAVAHAYFQGHISDDADLIRMEKRLRSPNLWSGTYVVYDDLLDDQTGSRERHVLYPRREDMIGFIHVNLGTPFFKVSQISFRSEFTLENLLYANLKLKMLLDENEAKKKETQAILKDMKVPFMDDNPLIRSGSVYGEPERVEVQFDDPEIAMLQERLQVQRKKYRRFNDAFRQNRPASIDNEKEDDREDNLTKTREVKLRNGSALEMRKSRTRKTDTESSYSDDSNDAIGNEYSRVVGHNKKSKGLVAALLLWIIGFYNFAVHEPLAFLLLLAFFLLFINFLKSSLSRMQN